MTVLSANCKYIICSLEREIPNLGKEALFCEADQHNVGELLESHTKSLPNLVNERS